MLIIREKRHILRILPAHRKTQKLRQQPRFFINLINSRAVISRIGAAQIPEIIGKIQRTGRGASRMIIIQRTDRLYFFKERIILFFLIGIHINTILQLMHNIEKFPILTELQMPWRTLQITADHIHKLQLPAHMIQTIHIRMIHSQIRHT